MPSFSNLADFLLAHKCPKGQKATHTRIPDKDLNIYGGSYLIPPSDLPEFQRLYCDHVFKQGKKEYLTECQLEKNGQMMVDLDFRYAYDVEKRIHTKEFVDSIVMEYMETMKEVYVFDKDTSVSVFVMEKPNVNRLADGSLTKDGIHIAFGLKVDYDKQLYIRQKMMAKDLLKDLPLINDAESVFDEGISKGTTNWQLFGSRKPGNEAYDIKYQYEITYDQSDGEFMFNEPEIAFDPLTHFQYLSAQFNEYHEYQSNPKWSASPSAPGKKKMMRIPSVASVTDSEPEAEPEFKVDNEKIKDLVFNYIGSRFNKDGLTKHIEYETKLKVSSALKTLGATSYMFGKWCELGAKRDIKDPMMMWESCLTMENKNVAFACLENILKATYPDKFKLWKKTNKKEDDKSFDAVAKEFEKNICKIQDTALFVKTDPDGDIVYSKQSLVTAYEHMIFEEVVTDKKGNQSIIEKNFIKSWMTNNPKQRIMKRMDCFPPDLKCPSDIYNTWRPFAFEKDVAGYNYDGDAVEVIKNHLLMLCGYDKDAWDYTLDWMASCIQFPSKKLAMPVWVSSEGAGKGTLIRLLEVLLGKTKVLSTQEPSKYCWGAFNEMMANAFIIVLDEVSKKETQHSEGQIKGLITEPTITINGKGKAHYTIASYHKFIATNNPDQYGNEPMTTTKDDRRKYFMRCSDEKIGDKEYFDSIYAMYKDDNKMKSAYEFFKKREIKRLEGKLPCTDYNNELKQASVPVLQVFIADLLSDENQFANTNQISSQELFAKFNKWTETTKTKYDCNSLQFGCRIANLNIAGMKKANHIGSLRGKGWEFDLAVSRKMLGIGCLL